jgi:hypothetical protein
MAIVENLRRIVLERESKHLSAECTYSVIVEENGRKFLQLDTYGSAGRAIPGKKSQSIRFTPEAIRQLGTIIRSEFE